MRTTYKIDTKSGLMSVDLDGMHLNTCKIADFNESINSITPELDMMYMPPGIAYIDPDLKFVIAETPPQYRTIYYTPQYQDNMKNDYNVDAQHSFFIPFPWIYKVIYLGSDLKISDITLYMGRDPWSPLGKFYSIPIHNIYEDDKLCRPVFNNTETHENRPSLFSIAQESEVEIWQSGFNNDLRDRIYTHLQYLIRLMLTEGKAIDSNDIECECHDDCSEDCDEDCEGMCYSCRMGMKKDPVKLPSPNFTDYCDTPLAKFIIENEQNQVLAFYKAWSQTPMEEVLNWNWGKSRNWGDWLEGIQSFYTNSPNLFTDKYTLIAFQNAAMKNT